MNQNTSNYDLWLFLDTEMYGDGKVAKELDKAVRKCPEFRGMHGNRLYFEFVNNTDKLNFIMSVMLELRKQGYASVMLKEEDKNIPKPIIKNGDIRKRIRGYVKVDGRRPPVKNS